MAKENKIGKKRSIVASPNKAIDKDGNVLDVSIGGIQKDALKTSDENSLLLKEVVKQLKINNKILNEVHGLYVNEQDIEEE